jgi:hypothetical protein
VLKLGDREHPVPPLTFGRFQALLAADTAAAVAALVEREAKHAPTLAVRLMRRSVLSFPWATKALWWIVDVTGLGVRRGGVEAAGPLVRLLVPTVGAGEWEAHAGPRQVAALFLAFAKSHDWPFIAEAIRFGEPREGGETLPSRTEVTAGLLSVAKQTGYRLEELLGTRVEGFYSMVDALREENERRSVGTTAEDEVEPPIAREAGIHDAFLERLAEAEGATSGS